MTAIMARRRTKPAEPVPYLMPSAAPWNVDTYCVTPTPDGTGSALHPSVLDFGVTGWNGWRFWMAVTPYFNNNDDLENPCILVSRDGFNWQPPAGFTNPVYPLPAGKGWQSDTELVHDPDTDELVLYYRTEFVHKHARSANGVTWTPTAGTSGTVTDLPGTTDEQVAATLVRRGANDWKLWTIEHPARTLRRWSSTSADGPWSDPKVTGGFGDIWHSQIRFVDGAYRCLVQQGWTTGLLFAMSSYDGLRWTMAAQPFLNRASVTSGLTGATGRWDFLELYRATFTPHENGTHYRVWYSGRNTGTSWRIGYTIVPRSLWPTPA